jgi:hypothetical protein
MQKSGPPWAALRKRRRRNFREGTTIGGLAQRDQQRDVEIDGRVLKSMFCASLIVFDTAFSEPEPASSLSSSVETQSK